ncbi:hypothetical protein [Shewanella sp. 10N.286.48.B5]|uniref:Kae1-like domain-containing protein n=1 Tax=Shewanella sp. 10N.286.48.B5 TaxID=1880834 RepID=UPI000C863DA2|nr:hypothetical protein [Shewanella sp. 10N.286.48.B5]PMH89352.1 hypothetical protein BCU57_00385 [Shewanella sp. 10N.286.48.B5]
MHKVSFNFTCQRPVAFYAQLCNQYIADTRFDFSAGFNNNRYFLEVEATEPQLAALADEIAAKFLYSIWLCSADVGVIKTRKGSQKPLAHAELNISYCSECQPQMVNAADTNFLKLDLVCPHCHGHERISTLEQSMAPQDLIAIAARLKNDTKISLSSSGSTYLSSELSSVSSSDPSSNFSLSLQPFAKNAGQQHILICNPQHLSKYFAVQQYHTLALSSLEKPRLKLMSADAAVFSGVTTAKHQAKCKVQPTLTDPYYQVSFADSRLLMALADQLNTIGIDWVYIDTNDSVSADTHNDLHKPLTKSIAKPSVTRINNTWVEIASNHQFSINGASPLHDVAQYKHYEASWNNKQIHCRMSAADNTAVTELTVTGIDAASCAMHAGLLNLSEAVISQIANRMLSNQTLAATDKQSITSATLYFSHDNPSVVITQNKQQKIAQFLRLPTFEQHGADIIAQLQHEESKVLAKFTLAFPQQIHQLALTTLDKASDNIQHFIGLAAMLILDDEALNQLTSIDAKADAFHALAQQYHGNNAPRIDFPLCSENGYRSINWRRTFASLMSFKLAGANPAILAFGFFDSLADYLSNWLDHLEQQQGIDAVVLAGNDLVYSVLAERLCMRLQKNYPLVVNHQLDLDGANIAIGGLYLAKRRGLR